MNVRPSTDTNTLAVLDARVPTQGTAAERRAFNDQLRSACYEVGAFYLTQHGIPAALCQAVLPEADRFFTLPTASKEQLNLRHSKHFRGYSQLLNERDWREQMHFGWELPASADGSPGPQQLAGPNLWPTESGSAWRATMLAFLAAADGVGQRLLALLEPLLNLPTGYFAGQAQPTPYLLMKLLCYHPPAAGAAAQQGIAPHCDWSWLTLLLQDQPGLQVRTRDGRWLPVPPVADTLVVNLGELLALVTAGQCHAVPHQVRHLAGRQPRLSIPVFINPSLSAVIRPPQLSTTLTAGDGEQRFAHVHRVIAPAQAVEPFVFGDSEWRRKGLGRWCYRTECRTT